MAPLPSMRWVHEPTLRAFLSALPFPAAVLDASGIVVATNPKWDEGRGPQALWGAGLGEGIPYSDVLDAATPKVPDAFALRHAVTVCATQRSRQTVDYDNDGELWRARVMPVPGGGGGMLVWHEPRPGTRLSAPPERDTSGYGSFVAPPPRFDVDTSAGSEHTSGGASEKGSARSDARACLRTVRAEIDTGSADPLLSLHQAHAGALLLSQLSETAGVRRQAEALRVVIERELRAAAGGTAVDWGSVREGLEACIACR